MKPEELRDMSDAELQQKIDENRERLFHLRRDLATRKEKNHQQMPALKKDIARVMTVLRERELMRMYGGEELDAVIESQAEEAAVEERPRRGFLRRRR